MIQGGSSDIAAASLFNLCNFLKSNNRKSKMFCFVHDSIEGDIHPEDLFFMVEQFKIQMNDYPRNTFGISTKADVALGATLGEEVAVKKSIPDEDYKGGILELKGHGDEVDRLIACWCEYFDIVEVEEISAPEVHYNIWKEIFQVKRSYYKNMGHLMTQKHVRVRLRLTDGKGCSIGYDNLMPMNFYDKFIPANIIEEKHKDILQKRYMDENTEIYDLARR